MAYGEPTSSEYTQRLDQKVRRCLRCQDEFDSIWAGDRICGKCKQTAAWRASQPAQPLSNRSRSKGHSGS